MLPGAISSAGIGTGHSQTVVQGSVNTVKTAAEKSVEKLIAKSGQAMDTAGKVLQVDEQSMIEKGSCESVKTTTEQAVTSTKRKLQFTVSVVKNDPLLKDHPLQGSTDPDNSQKTSSKVVAVTVSKSSSNVELSAVAPLSDVSSTVKAPVKKGRFRIMDVKEDTVSASVTSPQSSISEGDSIASQLDNCAVINVKGVTPISQTDDVAKPVTAVTGQMSAGVVTSTSSSSAEQQAVMHDAIAEIGQKIENTIYHSLKLKHQQEFEAMQTKQEQELQMYLQEMHERIAEASVADILHVVMAQPYLSQSLMSTAGSGMVWSPLVQEFVQQHQPSPCVVDLPPSLSPAVVAATTADVIGSSPLMSADGANLHLAVSCCSSATSRIDADQNLSSASAVTSGTVAGDVDIVTGTQVASVETSGSVELATGSVTSSETIAMGHVSCVGLSAGVFHSVSPGVSLRRTNSLKDATCQRELENDSTLPPAIVLRRKQSAEAAAILAGAGYCVARSVPNVVCSVARPLDLESKLGFVPIQQPSLHTSDYVDNVLTLVHLESHSSDVNRMQVVTRDPTPVTDLAAVGSTVAEIPLNQPVAVAPAPTSQPADHMYNDAEVLQFMMANTSLLHTDTGGMIAPTTSLVAPQPVALATYGGSETSQQLQQSQVIIQQQQQQQLAAIASAVQNLQHLRSLQDAISNLAGALKNQQLFQAAVQPPPVISSATVSHDSVFPGLYSAPTVAPKPLPVGYNVQGSTLPVPAGVLPMNVPLVGNTVPIPGIAVPYSGSLPPPTSSAGPLTVSSLTGSAVGLSGGAASAVHGPMLTVRGPAVPLNAAPALPLLPNADHGMTQSQLTAAQYAALGIPQYAVGPPLVMPGYAGSVMPGAVPPALHTQFPTLQQQQQQQQFLFQQQQQQLMLQQMLGPGQLLMQQAATGLVPQPLLAQQHQRPIMQQALQSGVPPVAAQTPCAVVSHGIAPVVPVALPAAVPLRPTIPAQQVPVPVIQRVLTPQLPILSGQGPIPVVQPVHDSLISQTTVTFPQPMQPVPTAASVRTVNIPSSSSVSVPLTNNVSTCITMTDQR
jgi:hypothetical protein